MAGRTGIGWELLAACDWMQCQARSRYSPVHGEKLGTVNPDGTVFRTRSAALAQSSSSVIIGTVVNASLAINARSISTNRLAGNIDFVNIPHKGGAETVTGVPGLPNWGVTVICPVSSAVSCCASRM